MIREGSAENGTLEQNLEGVYSQEVESKQNRDAVRSLGSLSDFYIKISNENRV